MATLPQSEEIAPRELKPALLELDGISRDTVEAHYKLYQGYVNKRNEILGQLAEVDLGAANQVYSEIRALKVDLTFAIGGIKNHEIYFEHLGGDGGDPDGPSAQLIERDFGSVGAWRADLKATGMAGRGWAWTAYDWDEGRLFNYIGDAQNTFPIWNATPLVALDVYEHAYFLDFQTDRASYIDAFFDEPRLGDVVNGWVERYGIRPVARSADDDGAPRRWPATSPAACPFGLLARARCAKGVDIRTRRQRQHRRDERLAVVRARARRAGRAARRREGLRARARRDARRRPARGRARRRRGDARPLAAALPRLRKGREDGRDRAAARSSASRRSSALVGAAVWIVSSCYALRLGRLDRRARVSLPFVAARRLGGPGR